jgi:hypothetical protein
MMTAILPVAGKFPVSDLLQAALWTVTKTGLFEGQPFTIRLCHSKFWLLCTYCVGGAGVNS